MDVVFALVGVSLVLVVVIAAVLIWAIRAGQFEDMEGPAWRVLMDDDRPGNTDETTHVPHASRQRGATGGARQDADGGRAKPSSHK